MENNLLSRLGTIRTSSSFRIPCLYLLFLIRICISRIFLYKTEGPLARNTCLFLSLIFCEVMLKRSHMSRGTAVYDPSFLQTRSRKCIPRLKFMINFVRISCLQILMIAISASVRVRWCVCT